MVGERACKSPNHKGPHGKVADQMLRSGSACRWKCPRCRTWFCSACEGTDDGLKVCDACAGALYESREADFDVENPSSRFVSLVRPWTFRGRLRDVLEHAAVWP